MTEVNFNKAYQTYDQHCHLQYLICHYLINKLHDLVTETDLIIDLGCGTGLSTQLIANTFLFRELHGIDTADKLLKVAKGKFLNQNNIKFYVSDYHQIPVSYKFNLLFSNMAFQWSHDIQSLFEKLIASCVHNGIIAFSLPVLGTFNELHQKYVHPLYSYADIINILKKFNLLIKFTCTKQYIEEFPSPLAALQSIKWIGANCKNNLRINGLNGKSFLSNFFKTSEYKLTYEIAYFIVEKI